MRNNSRDVLAVVVFFLFALVILACAGVASVQGQDDAMATPYAVRVVIEYSDGHTQVFDGDKLTATPSATVTPSVTASATASQTPSATATPDATALPVTVMATLYHTLEPLPNTSTPTPMNEPINVVLSPTPDALPTGTPIPTSAPKACTGTVINASGLTIRSAENTSATALAILAYNEQVTILSMHVISDAVQEWHYVRSAGGVEGYVAAYYYGGTRLLWWDDTQYECIPEGGMPITWDNPPPGTAWGIWNGPGASTDEVLAFISQLKATGISPAVTTYGTDTLATTAYTAGATVLARPWLSDCPDMSQPAFLSAQQRVDQALAALAGVRYTWLVLTNECVWPSTDYAVMWIQTAVAYAAQQGVTHLVPVVWPPGHPELSEVAALAAAYETNAEIPLGWGMNLYPVEQGIDLSAHGGISEWTVWRWMLYRHQLPDGLTLIVTEAARGLGSEYAVMDDLRAFVVLTDGELDIVTLWYNAQQAGLGHWPLAVLWGRLDEVAAAIVEALR